MESDARQVQTGTGADGEDAAERPSVYNDSARRIEGDCLSGDGQLVPRQGHGSTGECSLESDRAAVRAVAQGFTERYMGTGGGVILVGQGSDGDLTRCLLEEQGGGEAGQGAAAQWKPNEYFHMAE